MNIRKTSIIVILIILLGTGGYFIHDTITSNQYDELVEAGLLLVDSENYEEAILEFKAANEVYKRNDKADYYLAKSYFELEKYEEALTYINRSLEYKNKNNTDHEYILSHDVYLMLNEGKKAYYSLSKIDDDVALDHLNNFDLNKFDLERTRNYIIVYSGFVAAPDEIQKIDILIDKYPQKSSLYYIKSLNYFHNGNMREAIQLCEEAIALEPQPIYFGVLLSYYYNTNRIYECKILAQEIIDNHYDLLEAKQFLADIHMLLNEYDEALVLMNDIEMNKEDMIRTGFFTDNDLISKLVQAHTVLDNDDKALEYISIYENQNTYVDDIVKYFKEEINKKSITNDPKYLTKIFMENYMYEPNFEPTYGLSGILSDEEIEILFNDMKQEDDPFTFLVTGEDYDNFAFKDDEFIYEQLYDKLHYINFKSFTDTVAYDFIKVIDSIQNSKDSTLIVDLRDNRGGSLKSTLVILENLIGEGILFSEVSDKKYDVHYETDPKNYMKVLFKNVYIIVNNNSMSASEVMALSLREHLNNVTIIGEQTYGKGVSQKSFNLPDEKRMYYIVSYYWNVNDINIHGVGITPDIVVADEDIDDYMKEHFNLDDF